LNLMNVYLAQFKRGYAYTSVYLLRDRTDEAGNQTFGFFKPNYTPRKAAVYLHNLTTILVNKGPLNAPGQLDFAISDQPKTVHDLLLERGDKTFELIVWGERLTGQDHVKISLAATHPSATIYDPTIGVKPIQILSNVNSIELRLTNHPVVIAIPTEQ
jgi:hypothetical protein